MLQGLLPCRSFVMYEIFINNSEVEVSRSGDMCVGILSGSEDVDMDVEIGHLIKL
jgi:hypothetical protein